MDALQSRIRTILLSPETDLSKISARRVRKTLAEAEDCPVSPEFIKKHKDEVDGLITRIFHEINGTTAEEDADGEGEEGDGAGEDEGEGGNKRKRAVDGEYVQDGANGSVDDEDDDEEEVTPPPKKKAKGMKSEKDVEDDEELARQLSAELNGRPRAARAAATKPKTKRGRGKKGQSADVINSDSDDASDRAARKKKAKTKSSGGGGGGARGGFAKEYTLSEPLAAVLLTDRLSRPQVVKKMWEYIRANDLQNPSDKRQIICDEKLRRIFNAPKTDMFAMNKTLSQHLHEP